MDEANGGASGPPQSREAQVRDTLRTVLRNYIEMYREGLTASQVAYVLEQQWPKGRRRPTQASLERHLDELEAVGWLRTRPGNFGPKYYLPLRRRAAVPPKAPATRR